MKKLKYILLLFIFYFLFCISGVYAYEVNNVDYELRHLSGKEDSDVKKVCAYSSSGNYTSDNNTMDLVIIYNDNTAYYNMINPSNALTFEPHNINNWDKGDKNWDEWINDKKGLSNPVKDIFTAENECPDRIYHKSCFKRYIYLGYDKNLTDNQSPDDIVDSFNTSSCVAFYYNLIAEEEYSSEDLTTCEYEDFIIDYTKSDGVVRKATSKLNTPTSSYQITYTISKSYQNNYKLLDTKKCPVVYECDATSLMGNTIGKNFVLYVDELEAEQDYKGCSDNRKICISGEYCDPDYLGICPKYDEIFSDIKDNYNDYKTNKNISSINKANEQINKLKELCSAITKYADYDSSCMEQCLSLNDNLVNLGIVGSNDRVCGFSQKLIIYIANIVKWGKYLVPVIVIVLGILDFIQAIAADKDDGMKKAQGRFVKRLIAAALIFIIPFIIEFVLDKMGFGSNGCGIIDL